jgi:tellurite resistance protein TerC
MMAGALIVVQLIFLEGILSLDNAAVLGAMAAALPDDRPVPWPASLRNLGRILDRLLGPQRTAALRVGLLGAYAGRSLMLALAAWVMRSPWLKLLGALYLFRLATQGLCGSDQEEESKGREIERSRFWEVVVAVELADLAFSLDNVVAATALSDRLSIVVLGVAIGILIMRFAAGIFAYLVGREPILEQAAYGLVLIISVELLVEGVLSVAISDLAKFAISLGVLGLAIAYARLGLGRWLAPVLRSAQRGLRFANRTMERLGAPARGLYSTCVRFIERALSQKLSHSDPASGDIMKGDPWQP